MARVVPAASSSSTTTTSSMTVTSVTGLVNPMAALDEAFAAVARVVRPGAYAVVAVQNRRIGDRFVPLAWDAACVLGRRPTLGDERVHL